MRTKICTKCKLKKSLSEFCKRKSSKDGFAYRCKSCEKQYRKDNTQRLASQKRQYYIDNAPQILEQHKQYNKDNALQIAERQKQYRKDNASQIAKKGKQYRKDNALWLAEHKKQYNKDNLSRKVEYNKQYRKDKASQILKQKKQYAKNNAVFNSYLKQLETFEEIRRCLDNLELLEVKCAYCGKWMRPTNTQVSNRIQVFNGNYSGECRFYCSENCKISCPIYNQKSWPKGFKQATSREVVPLLRQLVLERDSYTCQKCGATTETAQLHVHHIIPYTQNKMQANDPDSCITLCKDCHKEVHQQDGCKYSDLSC